jgi:predicted acyltransferase
MATTQISPATSRLLALDVFRGWTIAFMIIVNTPGNGERSWSPLQHASWHGFTPTDLVFPSFLFIIGVSAFFSLRKFQGQPLGQVLPKIWRRTGILFLVGMLMWYIPGLVAAVFSGKLVTYLQEFVSNVRVLGVLGRLALCYGIGATLALRLSPRALAGFGVVALLAYWGLMRAFGQGPDPYALATNAALRFDLWLLGPNHLYHGESVAGKPFAFDPEGVLSTLPALVTFIIGFLCGRFLHQNPDRRWAISELFPVAFLLVSTGFLWDYWLGFPINKKLWTSSYTLFVGGLSMFLLALAVWLVDVKGKGRYLSFFHVFGLNPLLAYMVSEMGVVILQTVSIAGAEGRSQTAFGWLYAHTGAALVGDNALGSFLFSLLYMGACWIVSWICYRRGLIIKV